MKPVLKTTLVDEIVASIMEAIESGEMKPGERFPSERALAEQWSVSRTAVREAMKALSFSGVLEIRPGSGTYLKTQPTKSTSPKSPQRTSPSFDGQDMEERVQARMILEQQITRLAAQHATPQAIAAIEKACKRIEKCCEQKNVNALLKADYAFHQAVAAAAQNHYLQEAYERILLAGPEWFGITRLPFEQRAADAHNHYDICDTIKARDPDLASQIVLLHEESVWERYNSYYESPLETSKI